MYNDIIQLKTKHGHHELNKANYRPVTVLPALNNIFERLLAAQLGDFYNSILSDYISSDRKFHSCETSLLRMKGGMEKDERCTPVQVLSSVGDCSAASAPYKAFFW